MGTIARNIWKKTNGYIPFDKDGRTYEIHHKDGNNKNNNINNLECISIKEHYQRHYDQNDWGACTLIAKRIGLPIDYISNIQKGKKRPGMGGVPKGTIPWNKGKYGYKLSLTNTGLIHRIQANKTRSIISDKIAAEIRNSWTNKTLKIIDSRLNTKSKNGKLYSYKYLFCEYYSKQYNVSLTYIRRIIDDQSKVK